MSKKNKKQLITEVVYESLPKDSNPYKNIATHHLLFRWWSTGRSSESLRLTEEGKLAFDLAGIEFFDFPLVFNDKKNPLRVSEFTLTLSKKITCPFYVGLKTKQAKSAYIRIYDSKIAMLINLYGSFQDYLNSFKNYA